MSSLTRPGLAVESPEHAILICTGDSDLVDIRVAAISLLDPELPHLNLTRLPADNAGALVLLRALIFQDVCLPLVAKLVYDCMELFKTFELQRPTRSTPLPAVRTWHRRIPGLKKQPARAPLVDADSDSDSDYIP
ncbi:hypothetical protein BDZ89DRAFT_1151520 [Hymenopellis radicata]|nr:hypothetical protein BDZ89DRAFT_1151520 [Hymenopellis radicata]